MSTQIACHGCDLLIQLEELGHNETARCPRCGHFLTRNLQDSFSRTLAYSVAGAIFLTVSNLFPFITMEAQGLTSSMTLPQTALALYRYGMPYLSALVAVFIILLPAALTLILIGITLPLALRRPWAPLSGWAHVFFLSYNWAMVEVFIIGVVVSLFKIAGMADVTLGISFWGYVGFSLCFTGAIASLDRFQTWQAIEALQT